MKKSIFTLSILLLIIPVLMLSCKKEKEIEADPLDSFLLDAVTVPGGGYTYYKGTNTIRASANASGHEPFFTVRFNPIAKNALNADGKLPAGAVFPDSSIIVKDLYKKQNPPVNLFAVMAKLPNHPYASNGWVWGEYRPGGRVVISVRDKGVACTGSHSQTPNRDLVRLFDLHP